VSDRDLPQMSVVLVTPDNYQTIRKTIRHLRAQTVRDRLEIVIGAPSRETIGRIEPDLEPFHSYKLLEVGEIRILTDAKAAAVTEASASIVAFAEDHCFPEPDWAEALITAHKKGYAAVGPLMRNANPATALSWAGLFLHYGRCIVPDRSGQCTNLPWHNTTYKRKLLLDYGSELASMLIVEGLLLDDLRAKGHTLHLEPMAKTNHVNISLLWSWVRHAFWGGRLFGAMRAKKKTWSVWRRLLYIAGSPLIPIVRFCRTAQQIRELKKGPFLSSITFPVLVGLIPHAVGEATGYALGVGEAAERYSYFETARILHVKPADRAVFAE
jgi:hypothetical protein